MTYLIVDDVALSYPIIGQPSIRANTREKSEGRGMGNISLDRSRMRNVTALRDISFSLTQGDRLAVIGRNGAGKSTLLKVLAGIYWPNRGRVFIEGKVATLFNMGVGMRRSASGYRNIILQAMMAGLDKKQAASIVEDVAEFTELGDFLHLPVKSYSQGMAMRLNFAVATAIAPEILIMDEWIGAGDAQFREQASKRLRSVADRAGILVLASHNEGLLKKNCNKALWLESGVQRAYGDIDNVLSAFTEETKTRRQKAKSQN